MTWVDDNGEKSYKPVTIIVCNQISLIDSEFLQVK